MVTPIDWTSACVPRVGAAAMLTAAIACMCPAPALAQDTQPLSELDELSLEQLLDLEVQSVFGASKFLQKISEAPASVTVVTADEIRRFGYRNLADVLGRTRAFFTTYDRLYAYVGVRGFQRLGDYNTRILLLIDGIRTNDSVYEQASIGDEFHLDLDLIERIEIIRGASSSLYGSNAFLGVVNVVTKQASQMPGVRVGATTGSFGARGAQASVGHSFGKGASVLASASIADVDGQRALYFPELDSETTNRGVAERLDWQQRRNLFGQLVVGGLSVQGTFSTREKGVPTGAWGIVFNEPSSRVSDEVGLLSVGYDRRVGAVDVRLRGSLGYSRYDGHLPFDASDDTQADPADEPTSVVFNRDTGVGNWWTSETMVSTTWKRSHRLTSGLDVRHNFDQDQRNYDVRPFVNYLDDQRTSYNWAWYAQDEWRVHRQHLLNVGVRQDYATQFNAPVMPRVAWVMAPSTLTTVKLLYGGAFRAPSAYETWYAYGDFKGNPDLTPERIRTVEAVLERYVGRRYKLSANLFRYWVNDLITQRVDPADERLVYLNDGDARAMGMEVEVEGRWRGGVTGRASYVTQRAVDSDTGALLESSPRHLGQVVLTFPLFTERLHAAVDVQVVGARTDALGQRTDPFAVPNLTIVSPTVLRHLDISFSVYNALDAAYAHPVAPEMPQLAIRQDGRTMRLRATWRF